MLDCCKHILDFVIKKTGHHWVVFKPLMVAEENDTGTLEVRRLLSGLGLQGDSAAVPEEEVTWSRDLGSLNGLHGLEVCLNAVITYVLTIIVARHHTNDCPCLLGMLKGVQDVVLNRKCTKGRFVLRVLLEDSVHTEEKKVAVRGRNSDRPLLLRNTYISFSMALAHCSAEVSDPIDQFVLRPII